MTEIRSQRRSLIYPIAGTRQIIQVEALGGVNDPDYYPGRTVLIYYGGVDGTQAQGIPAQVEQRIISGVGDGRICLNSPLKYDLIGDDVSELLLI